MNLKQSMKYLLLSLALTSCTNSTTAQASSKYIVYTGDKKFTCQKCTGRNNCGATLEDCTAQFGERAESIICATNVIEYKN